MDISLTNLRAQRRLAAIMRKKLNAVAALIFHARIVLFWITNSEAHESSD